ncbi:MAG: response regulator [Ktedonobacterales bacterium]|nr:response regulator [Ktedonobacterales bacterium]
MVPVLVVDDNREIREALRLALEDAGYVVAEAEDGARALEVLREATEGMVVLLDVMMPRLDGPAVLRTVIDDTLLARRHAYVLITANIAAVPLEQARDRLRLAVPILQKPFNMQVLLDAVALAARRLVAA